LGWSLQYVVPQSSQIRYASGPVRSGDAEPIGEWLVRTSCADQDRTAAARHGAWCHGKRIRWRDNEKPDPALRGLEGAGSRRPNGAWFSALKRI
jgi:hypothetical protein